MSRGQGHIRAKGKGRWEVIVSAGSDPITGRRRQISRTVHGPKADAVAALNALTAEVRAGGRGGADSTLGELVARYLEVADLSATYRADVSRVVGWLPVRLAGKPIWKIRPDDLDSLYAALRADGRSPYRIARLHDAVSAACGRAVKWGWLSRNPAEGASPPARPRRLRKVPSEEAMGVLLERAGPAFATYLTVAFVTGARRGEMCGLQWGDVEERRVWFRRSVSYTPASGITVKTTKGERERVVMLDLDTAGILAGWRAEQAAQLFAPIVPGTFVFTRHPQGAEPWRPDYPTHLFIRLRDQAGLSDVRLHDLRHAAATYALRAGYEVHVVSARLGHSSPSVTQNVYSHVLEGRDAEMADTLGLIIRKGGLPVTTETT